MTLRSSTAAADGPQTLVEKATGQRTPPGLAVAAVIADGAVGLTSHPVEQLGIATGSRPTGSLPILS